LGYPNEVLKDILMENIYISYFKNCKSEPTGEISLAEWLLTDKFKEKIQGIRGVLNKEDQKILKADLPCATISGLFSARKKDKLIIHSGYICIDIDAGDNPHIKDFNNLRCELTNITNVAYVSLSASGNGVFCLVPVKYPEKHKEHFEALKNDFKTLGIVIDKSCGDVTRLRFCSYDENLYYNKDAELYIKLKGKSISNKSNISRRKKTRRSLEVTNTKIERIVKQIESCEEDITEGYDQWFRLGCALAHELGEEGRSIFHRISQFSNKYDETKTDNQYSNCISHESSEPCSIGTFFFYASKYGFN